MGTPRTGLPSRVKLRPADAFDLIRLLARSQSDPRKAVAELVQNSLDANARRIEIAWFNEKGRRTLRIWDDGTGVFPELERDEALRRIASTIGHSHKLDLTPAQRREQMVLGKYGIGLIGFWSVGEVLEMKTRVAGGPALVLRLREDHPQGEVYPSRARMIDEPPTFTEVTIRGVHEGAQGKIRPPRLQAFLASELRGQLLERGAVVLLRDRVARGRARKEFVVEPRPYLGSPLEDWRELEVPGFESARVELYSVSGVEERRGTVTLACGGTTVLDDIAEIDGADTLRMPWVEGRLEGVIDFPELHVSPASRRGFAHDEPVAAFLSALAKLEAELEGHLAEESRRRAAQHEEGLAREIRKAFRSVARFLPDYDFFSIRSATAGAVGREGTGAGAVRETVAERGTGEAIGEAGRRANEEGPDDARELEPPHDDLLFPPGPLARVELAPKTLRLPPLASRTIRARAADADGRSCPGPIDFAWRLEGAGELVADEHGSVSRRVFTAPDPTDGDAPEIRIVVVATQGDARAEAAATVRLIEPGSGRAPGIPDPKPVTARGESWRSRIVEGRWEYNDAHPDYLAVADVQARRLRYLIHLFAKEVVLKNFGGPGDAEVLERMVEVLTRIERRA